MPPQPSDLKLISPAELQIAWSDGAVLRYPVQHLRDNCPCAFCVEKRSAEKPPELLPVLSMAETQPTRIARMEPKGNYAYAIDFSDGHDTGIYTLDLLREIGIAE